MNKDLLKNTEDFIDFIYENPTTYHEVAAFVKMLEEDGFIELREEEKFNIEKGKSYYVKRNDSALIAFRVPSGEYDSYSIASAHTDAPCFKVKHNPEIVGDYTTLNVESYGGLLLSPWFDRPLSLAGRVFVRENDSVVTKFINFDRDLVQIVSLAIHQNRKANEGINYNVQKELMPIIAMGKRENILNELICEELGIEEKDILDFDLFLYARNKGSIWGSDNEFFSSPRIDDVECGYAAIKGLLEAKESDKFAIVSLFDNEEVGSGTRQGALSDFLTSTLSRIEFALGLDAEKSAQIKASSMMLSADNAHARHPNYSEASDVTNKVFPNKGIVIKYSSNQKYATDGFSAATLKLLLDKNGVPYQLFFNNSNMPGGSTLGNLSIQKYSIHTVDIGAAQLAMHSVYESAGSEDLDYMIKTFSVFFRG